MSLHHSVRRRLPPLAWLLQIDGTPQNHQLLCGSSVVVGDAGFVEGAWPGDLAAMDFAAAAEMFGSGGTFTGGWRDMVRPGA